MTERWPSLAEAVQARRDAYLARLDALDAQVRQWLSAVPRESRRVITSHEAFGYFGAAYGIDFMAPQGWNAQSEPSAAAVARLIRQIRQERVKALFVENISDARLIRRIADETGARVGGTLYSDALSSPVDRPRPTSPCSNTTRAPWPRRWPPEGRAFDLHPR